MLYFWLIPVLLLIIIGLYVLYRMVTKGEPPSAADRDRANVVNPDK
jgi:cytochrome c-type biogenesis protein CcmH/NrfF